jgi:hypothetical protein
VRLHQRVETLEAQYQPKDDHRFLPWGGDEGAWRDVPLAERERFWASYQKAGPYQGPCIVRRQPDGSWRLAIFNTKLGGCEYRILSTWREMGHEAMVAWLSRECTEPELRALVRAVEGGWNPERLEDGDAVLLDDLARRLPRMPLPGAR